jgi:hypothetical protein
VEEGLRRDWNHVWRKLVGGFWEKSHGAGQIGLGIQSSADFWGRFSRLWVEWGEAGLYRIAHSGNSCQ